MRLLIIGSARSTAVFLDALTESPHEIVGLITRPGSPSEGDWCDLVPWAARHGVPVLAAGDANAESAAAFIDGAAPEVILCLGWNQLLSPGIYEKAPWGGIGFHPAALPKNRGRHPLIWALALGLTETAATFFRLAPKADAGAILAQQTIPIGDADDAGQLYDRVMAAAVPLLLELLGDPDRLKSGGVQQTPGSGNRWRKRTAADGRIDWRMSTRSILNLVRALRPPYPGATFLHRGAPVVVWRAENGGPMGDENLEPGKVLSGGPCPVIKTGDGCIRLTEWEAVELDAGEYL